MVLTVFFVSYSLDSGGKRPRKAIGPGRFRAILKLTCCSRGTLPSTLAQLETFQGLLPEGRGRNLALTVLYVLALTVLYLALTALYLASTVLSTCDSG